MTRSSTAPRLCEVKRHEAGTHFGPGALCNLELLDANAQTTGTARGRILRRSLRPTLSGARRLGTHYCRTRVALASLRGLSQRRCRTNAVNAPNRSATRGTRPVQYRSERFRGRALPRMADATVSQ